MKISPQRIQFFLGDISMVVFQTKIQHNGTIVTNMTSVIDEIRATHNNVTLAAMATRVGVTERTLKGWLKSGRARLELAKKLRTAFPCPAGTGQPSVNYNSLTIPELFDSISCALRELQKQVEV
jgi:DNA-binding transcriptional regulator YiaG